MKHKALVKKFEALLLGSNLKLFISTANKKPEIMDEGFWASERYGAIDHSAWFYVTQAHRKRIMRSKSLDGDLYYTLRTIGLDAEPAFVASLLYG